MPGVAGLFPKPEIQMKLTNTLAALGMVASHPPRFAPTSP
jgi:hypothetical protein